jgi:hypothetical protein
MYHYMTRSFAETSSFLPCSQFAPNEDLNVQPHQSSLIIIYHIFEEIVDLRLTFTLSKVFATVLQNF